MHELRKVASIMSSCFTFSIDSMIQSPLGSYPKSSAGVSSTSILTLIFKPCAWPSPGFLKLLWFVCWYVCVCVCVSVCPPPRPLITSGVMWCDIDRVRLVKPVLRLFPAFNYFIQRLPSIKWMGMAILTQHIVNSCQRKLR